jgi:hypothetical protein
VALPGTELENWFFMVLRSSSSSVLQASPARLTRKSAAPWSYPADRNTRSSPTTIGCVALTS